MRDLSFRGKDSTGAMNNDWFYGSLDTTFNEDFPRIICKDRWENTMLITVDGETVGQYTGLKDKNGRKIFEGDIVKVYLAYKTIVCIVKWEDCSYVLQDIKIQDYKYSMGKSFELEVIGNIYDNPELLEVADGR